MENGTAKAIIVNGITIDGDIILSGADYHHSESLLDEKYRAYSSNYWENRTFAPSSLLFYVGFDKKIENVEHHSLFFDVDFDVHAEAIYDNPKWPEEPLFYASFPSKTDSHAAPSGKEVAFVGQRDGKVYDIYKISVNGGEEIQLTNNKGTHVDGPEYSPDGKYIYYNGNTSGTMHI